MTKSLRYSLISAVALVAAGSGLALAEPAAVPALVVAQNEKPASELAPSRFGGHVHALAVNPKTNELFLGARPIYRSGDGGKTWKAVEGIPKTEERANITSISIDPSDAQVMYATGHGVGVVKSTDGGETWEAASAGLDGMSTEGFAIDAKDPSKLYVWVLGTGLYRSNDAAASWQRVDDGPKKQEIRALASANNPTGMGGIWLYAALDTGVMKSPDCFCGWDRLSNAGLPDGRVYSLAVDSSDSKVLYAGLRQGVFKSKDGGQTWAQATDLVEDAVVTVNAAKPNEVYAVGADGTLVSSSDAGANWTKVEDDDVQG
ncbi:WD40/YVTN/BNR-like repeat-containing protein [Pseudaminobacter sp. NGMCC 1.201702]|uniref:WD40/YVTN/BNR-like repeat-containing protein n=1 Tax=Pseudaminobacter sp. NGMCC 1.201702 TaxID=3391825 RepID=UPI0039EF2549